MLAELRAQNKPESSDPNLAKAAERGTRIHKARETGNTLELQPDELEAYEKMCRMEARAVEQWQRDFNIEIVPTPILGTELGRLWLHDPDTLAPIVSGEVDLVYRAGRYVLIPDFKSGSGYYAGDIKTNWQGRIYALLVWKEFDPSHVRFVRIFPEAIGRGIEAVDFSESLLRQIEQAALLAVWKSKQPDAQQRPGWYCALCPARADCRAAARESLLPTIQREPDFEQTLAKVNTLPIEMAREVWRRRGEVKKIMDAITARLVKLPDDEKARIGLTMKEGARADYIEQVGDCFNAMLQAGFAQDDVLSCMTFSKAMLIELIATYRDCSKKEAEEWYEQNFDPYIKRERKTPSLEEV